MGPNWKNLCQIDTASDAGCAVIALVLELDGTSKVDMTVKADFDESFVNVSEAAVGLQDFREHTAFVIHEKNFDQGTHWSRNDGRATSMS
jgi:hypothetical protein